MSDRSIVRQSPRWHAVAFLSAIVSTVLWSAAGGGARTIVPARALDDALASFVQQGPKLVGSGAFGNAMQGWSVSISADGNTALVGGPYDDLHGAMWVWTRSGGVWSQQGPKLIGSDAEDFVSQATAVALSADGNTALVGEERFFDSFVGGVWVWTRSDGVWSQQGPKLVGSGAAGDAGQGAAVALSADGNTALVCGPYDDNNAGALWVWTRHTGAWTQQGSKLVGSGHSVALSADGNMALVGDPYDDNSAGAVWVWTRSDGVWTQGPKLVGSGAVMPVVYQGSSVALSADGNTALIAGSGDDNYTGAVWVWTRSDGVWTQEGTKLVGSGAVGKARQGTSVSLSADGNTALVGGEGDNGPPFGGTGATWVWRRSNGVWTQQGHKLVGGGAAGKAAQGASVSLSGDGNTALVGGPLDLGYTGAAWIFATFVPFTDDLLTPGVTVIKAAHVVELRTRIDSLRAQYGLGAFYWTDPTLTVGFTPVRAQHVLQMRQALREAYLVAGRTPPSYSDPDLTIGTAIKVVHISELRAAILVLENS
jgi:hypothetical protein